MKNNSQIAQQFKQHQSITQRNLSAQYDNTRRCQAFYAGDVMSYQDKIQFNDSRGGKRRAMVQFNKVKPYVNAVKGFMAQNRRKSAYIAKIQNSQIQQAYSKYANSLADFLSEEANADQVRTQQDGDMLINGYGATETALTYGVGMSTTDPNGQVQIARIDPLSVGFDPYAKETNLLDARWVFYQNIYELRDAMELFDAGMEDFESSNVDSMGKDSGYEYFPDGGRYDKIKETGNVDWADQSTNMVRVYFYQWFEFETFYRADNPIKNLSNPQAKAMAQQQLEAIKQDLTARGKQDDLFELRPDAQILTFDSETKAMLDKAFGEFITSYPFKRKVYYSAVLSGGHIFTKYKNICQQGFTIKFKTGDYDAKNKIWTGMVNSMMQPQLYYNKSLTELMFIIGANSKGGVMYEKGSISDIADFEAKYAKTDGNVEVEEGAISGGKIRAKREAYAPSGYENILQISNDSINDVNGIDKTFLGSSENRNETGILQKRRIRQVVSALACYFDSLTLYEKEQARLMLDLMRVYAENNDGALFRVLGEDGTAEFVQISADKLAAQYDVIIQEAPQTAEDKQEFATTLIALGDKLKAAGDASANVVYSMALKYMPLDQEDLLQLTQVLNPNQQQVDPQYVKQLEQQLETANSTIMQADVQEKISRTEINKAKLQEVSANIQKILADTTNLEQKAVQTGLENQAILTMPERVNISI